MAYHHYPYGSHSSTQPQYTDYSYPMAQSFSESSSTSSRSDSSNTTYGSSASNGFVHLSEVFPHASEPWSQAAVTAPPAPEDTPKPQKVYCCLVPGCHPKTKDGVFTRAADLARHIQTVHNAAPATLDCPYAKNWCERNGVRGFSRRDHLNEHIRQVHPGKPQPRQEKAGAPAMLDCPCAKNGCERTGTRGFSRKNHLSDHIRQVHPGKAEFRQ